MKTLIDFTDKKEFFRYLFENKNLLLAEKKKVMKEADCVSVAYIGKSNAPVSGDVSVLKTRLIINTTNLLDSHSDVHLPGLWTKSLQENKNIYHLQEHNMAFDKVISDGEDLNAYVKEYSWNELGIDWSGKTEALTFDSNVRKERNTFMFEQYKAGRVKNHSVGMQYVKVFLAINDIEYIQEYENWGKYYPEIINKEIADEQGYFWAVKEAKVIEGSAVIRGSNWATPTLENNMKREPGNHSKEPYNTQKLMYLIENFKL